MVRCGVVLCSRCCYGNFATPLLEAVGFQRLLSDLFVILPQTKPISCRLGYIQVMSNGVRVFFHLRLNVFESFFFVIVASRGVIKVKLTPAVLIVVFNS